jgi:ATP-dependent Lon protease
MNAELQHSISEDMEKMVGDKDREYFLQERLKMIQKELGLETLSRDKLIEKFKKRVAKLTMPEQVKKVFDEVHLIVFKMKPY